MRICVALRKPHLNATVFSGASVSSSSFLAVSTRTCSTNTDGVTFAYFANNLEKVRRLTATALASCSIDSASVICSVT